MRSMVMPSRSHQTESFERLTEQGVGTGEGDAVVGADGDRQAALGEQPFESGKSQLLADRLQRLAEEQKPRGMVGDGERVAIAPIAELELAFEVGAPQVIGHSALG